MYEKHKGAKPTPRSVLCKMLLVHKRDDIVKVCDHHLTYACTSKDLAYKMPDHCSGLCNNNRPRSHKIASEGRGSTCSVGKSIKNTIHYAGQNLPAYEDVAKMSTSIRDGSRAGLVCDLRPRMRALTSHRYNRVHNSHGRLALHRIASEQHPPEQACQGTATIRDGLKHSRTRLGLCCHSEHASHLRLAKLKRLVFASDSF
jgi:hypothetical protein